MNYLKYPRTPHLPWSNPSSDDKIIKSLDAFIGQRVVVTEKMDGENTTIYSDGYYHARSIDSTGGNERGYVREAANILLNSAFKNARICGENLYSQHSIKYDSLSSYFQVFGIWYLHDDFCLSWRITETVCEDLELVTVPVLYIGLWDEDLIKGLYKEGSEGYVVRLYSTFHMKDFETSVAKYVRPNHVQTDKHWKTGSLVTNKLKNK